MRCEKRLETRRAAFKEAESELRAAEKAPGIAEESVDQILAELSAVGVSLAEDGSELDIDQEGPPATAEETIHPPSPPVPQEALAMLVA